MTSSALDEARAFIASKVLQPALVSPDITTEVKNTIKNSQTWLGRFKRTGDIVAYINRFQADANTDVFFALRNAGLLTFEDIREEFLKRFGVYSDDVTRLDDFIVGRSYTSSDLVIFAKTYNNLGGGILPIGEVGNHIAVFIKATLTGGSYSNKWLKNGYELQYFLKSRKGKYLESYLENRSIIEFPDVPVYAFVRNDASERFVLSGVFRSSRVVTENDGAKWFYLVRQEKVEPAVEMAKLEADLQQGVTRARADSREARRARLKVADKTPTKVIVLTTAFVRNPDVVAEVLDRAEGVCEGCGNPAPFLRTTNASPYLEVHHKLPLSKGGLDAVENAVALCANCHRQEHFGSARWPTTDG
ncbi:5-methylcytosine-specific restriction protein A [Devosia subaequoris]|uniref:5-methylcytosine-specific restriction protein A n=1 Tax=Devosia subaequoris TaxID=395930 RepID=A0A7W6IQR8_9HYPH|nr:HNH endonuclease [Devosia subaequoris]MBB4054076.1 5-methylcytosine-specific restriction protein A [Devosia subaequoris]MCP1211329.1 HNH endonuclease [Devosia subaequoris]